MEEPGVYSVEGPKVERMLGYTNLESEKGFEFFQKFMKENGVLKRLEELGIEEGDTVKLYRNGKYDKSNFPDWKGISYSRSNRGNP